VESELFGHLKGSFTGADKDKQGLFQAAKGGTLFLDEIADLPLQIQVKLLRVIQEKAVRPVGSQKEEAVDVRLLSATHKNLAREVELGNMRQDLFFRINVIELAVPSLRERQEDLQELTLTILNKIAKEDATTVCEIDDEALASLRQYSFPGNVRELENILQRAATLCEDRIIRAANLEFMNIPQAAETVEEIHPQAISDNAAQINNIVPESSSNDIPSDFSLEKHLESIEIGAIEKALEETRWNKTAAAKKLGNSFRSLRYRLKNLGLD
jgi:two-component system response regulator PilR (NtrC family)